MPVVAVVAHSGKSLGGGLEELRQVLAQAGCDKVIWHEVTKSRKAPKRARAARDAGAELIFVWGGDGTVQRCIDALAGKRVVLAIVPAGTANLLATNLGVPADIAAAVQIGLNGQRRPLDTGSVNGEHFAVMAGAGFDAAMIKLADRGLKDRFGRAAYLYAGARSLRARRARADIKVDGAPFFTGRASCVLVGNVSKILANIEAFPAARPDDGLLDLGVITAANPFQWARTLGRVATGRAAESRYVHLTRGKKMRLRFDRPLRYELDGGARSAVTKLRVKVHPASITVCVPACDDGAMGEAQDGGSR